MFASDSQAASIEANEMATAFKCSLDLPLQDFEGRIGLVELISQLPAFFRTLAYSFAKAGIPCPVV